MSLYIVSGVPGIWVAKLSDGTWAEFPAEFDGWNKRRPAMGLDPLRLRQVPAKLGFNTGFPDAIAENFAA